MPRGPSNHETQEQDNMNHTLHPIAMICLVASLTACGDATTDADLPAGQAPNPAGGQADTGPGDQHVLSDKPAAAGRESIPGMSWVSPEGWTTGPDKQMRVLTLLPPNNNDAADAEAPELAVSYWPNGVGSLNDNLARWASPRFMSLSPQQLAEASQNTRPITVGGKDAVWIPMTNPATGKSMVGIWVPGAPGPNGPAPTWVFKLTGTTPQVQALEPAFKQWLDSIAFE